MVTAIVFISIVAALIAVVTVFLLKGIRVKVYFDLETATLVADAFVFGNLHAVKYKAFECNGYIYGQLNSRELKRLDFSDKKREKSEIVSEKSGDEEKEGFLLKISDKINEFTSIFGDLSGVKLKTLRAYLTVGMDNSLNTSLIVSSIITLLGIIGTATRDKIRIKNADIAVYPNFRYDNTVLTLDIDTGSGLAGILARLVALKIKLSIGKRKKRAEV